MTNGSKIIEGIAAFAEAELIPRMEGWRVWAAAAVISLAKQRGEAIYASLADNKVLAALGVISDQGVDVDVAISALKEAITKHGKLELDLGGLGMFKLSEDDLNRLKSYIQ